MDEHPTDPRPTRVDLHDITRCPLGHRCESCGAERADLAVATRTIIATGAAYCLTMCPPCAASNVPPPITVGTADRLMIQHCQHLGCEDGAS